MASLGEQTDPLVVESSRRRHHRQRVELWIVGPSIKRPTASESTSLAPRCSYLRTVSPNPKATTDGLPGSPCRSILNAVTLQLVECRLRGAFASYTCFKRRGLIVTSRLGWATAEKSALSQLPPQKNGPSERRRTETCKGKKMYDWGIDVQQRRDTLGRVKLSMGSASPRSIVSSCPRRACKDVAA